MGRRQGVSRGDWISLNGSTGNIIEGKVATMEPELSGEFAELMALSTVIPMWKYETNADTPKRCLWLVVLVPRYWTYSHRTYVFEVDRIKAMREMILADTVKGRKSPSTIVAHAARRL